MAIRNRTDSSRVIDLTNMLCCCCWSQHRCAISLAVLDTVIAGALWYRSVDLLFSSFYRVDRIDIFVFIVLFGLFVCELLATAALVLSYRRRISRYVTPRFVLLAGQLIMAIIACIIVALYFGGLSLTVNSFIISCYEYWSGLVLSDDERKVTFNELSSYAVGLFVLLVVYATYNVFEIYVTYKYQRNINPPSEFSLVSQTDHLYPDLSPAHALSRDQQASVSKVTQRPPPYNPNYGPAPPYKL